MPFQVGVASLILAIFASYAMEYVEHRAVSGAGVPAFELKPMRMILLSFIFFSTGILLSLYQREASLLSAFYLFLLTAIVSGYEDLRHKVIEDEVSLFLSVMSLIHLFAFGGSLLKGLAGFAAGGAILFLIALLPGGGMGGADIKLMASFGIILGFKLVLTALLIAFVIGAVIGVLLMLMGLVKKREPIAFSPFLSVGAIAALLFGDKLIGLYIATLI